MAPKPTPPTTPKTMEEFQKEFRGKLYAAIATSLVAGLVAAVIGIWGYVQTLPGSLGLTPTGAVVAFDRKDGCPKGWSPYSEAWGRFVIGAVTADDIKKIPGGFLRDAQGADLTPKPFREPGGEEMHTLTVEEMPSHQHGTPGPIGTDGNRSGRQDAWFGMGSTTTSAAGGNKAHNNLPPYIALHYCRKD